MTKTKTANTTKTTIGIPPRTAAATEAAAQKARNAQKALEDALKNAPPLTFNPKETHYTPEEAADMMKSGLSTVRTWLREGKIRYFRAGRRILIPQSEITRFMQARTEG